MLQRAMAHPPMVQRAGVLEGSDDRKCTVSACLSLTANASSWRRFAWISKRQSWASASNRIALSCDLCSNLHIANSSWSRAQIERASSRSLIMAVSHAPCSDRAQSCASDRAWANAMRHASLRRGSAPRRRVSSAAPRMSHSGRSSVVQECASDGAALSDRRESPGVLVGEPRPEPAAVCPALLHPCCPCERKDELRTCERDGGGRARARTGLPGTPRTPRLPRSEALESVAERPLD